MMLSRVDTSNQCQVRRPSNVEGALGVGEAGKSITRHAGMKVDFSFWVEVEGSWSYEG